MEKRSVIITGTGSYVPEKVVTNDDLAKMMDTSDEWIYSRSGIKQRRIARPDEATSDMAAAAGKNAIESAGLKPEDIDLVIVATVNPDMPLPNTACIVQTKLGIRTNIPCFDIEAACSGFVYGMEIATRMMQSGHYKNALVIGAEKLSSMVDWEDRAACVLFGDGAGAVVLTLTDDENVGVLDTVLGADGSDNMILAVPAGGSAMPTSAETVKNKKHFLHMEGREVFKHAVKIMQEKSFEVLERCGVKPEDITLMIPHQANIRIIEAVTKRLNLPKEKVYVNIDKYANTSAATIPIALDEVVRGGMLKKGDLLVLVAFGAGLTWGATLVRWH